MLWSRLTREFLGEIWSVQMGGERSETVFLRKWSLISDLKGEEGVEVEKALYVKETTGVRVLG